MTSRGMIKNTCRFLMVHGDKRNLELAFILHYSARQEATEMYLKFIF